MTARALWATLLALFLSIGRLSAAEPDADSTETGGTVLCYHIVESPQDPRMEISRETFLQQMRYLAMTGYTVVPLRDIYEYATGKKASLPRHAVAITIDDGWRSTYTEVFPEMKRRHFPFTVFLYPQIIGRTAHAMTWKQVKEMADAGVDIESHSYSHPYLTQRYHPELDDKQYSQWLSRELRDSKRTLERETGRTVSFLAYPYGEYDHHLLPRVASAGYEAALTCDYGHVKRGSNPLRMKRVIVDKRIDFALFRKYLGAGSMQLAEMTPQPGQLLDGGQNLTISAKIPDHESLDPHSVGIVLLSLASSIPYAYDPADGSVTLVIKDAVEGTLQRALVWATDLRSGKRVEASWTFHLPGECPAVDPGVLETKAPVARPAASARGVDTGGDGRLQFRRIPKR